jgi:peptidyl-prolyl cis-trans isomerase SurA
VIREEFGGDRSAFLRTLAAQGYTLEKFKEQQRDVVIVQEMRRIAMKGATPTVSEDKILKAYRERAAEFTSEDQIKLRMIAIKQSGASNSRRKMIEEIREKIVEGAEFQDLARMYSEDPTQEAGGDWGWINRKQLNEQLTKIAFSLKPGQVSDVVEMSGSYYLLYVEAKKPAVTKPLKEVRDELEKQITQQERQKLQQDWLLKLRKKAFVKVF